MKLSRRHFVKLTGALALSGSEHWLIAWKGASTMDGLISRVYAVPGQRDALIAILLEGTEGMPGCLSYIVAVDPEGSDSFWVTEVWDSRESHQSSLSLPSVKQAMAKGKPLIARFGERFTTAPVGGHGLASKTGL
jgi:quinol monooxygenase YgiN